MKITRHQLEARVLDIVDTVQQGRKVEDDNIELKADWPDPVRAARRIAGHANAARGEDIIWIIGLDENEGVKTISDPEFADWWAQVSSKFDSQPPTFDHFVIETGFGKVTAICFATDASPFVVKNPSHGTPGGNHVELEVPWRQGTAVRSARREDLIRLLVPLQMLPDIEPLYAKVRMKRAKKGQDGAGGIDYLPTEGFDYVWIIELSLYVVPPDSTQVVLPKHRVGLSLFSGATPALRVHSNNIRFTSSEYGYMGGLRSQSFTVLTTGTEAIIGDPGRLRVVAEQSESRQKPHSLYPDYIHLVVTPARTNRHLTTTIPITLQDTPPNAVADMQWEYRLESV